MRFDLISKCVLLLSIVTVPVEAQEVIENTISAPRVFLDSDIGIRSQLGYVPPASDFGASFEYPLWRKFEIQGAASYSADNKEVTKNGSTFTASGTGIFWLYSRWGVLAEADYSHLWTSQFSEASTAPSIGVVLRTRYEYPGRLYLRYLLPTGCVWATPSNPCRLQSKRLQGPSIRQEFQLVPHVRWGAETGLYHFCDQSNEDEPTIPRTCHWGTAGLLFVRFQFQSGPRDELY